VVEAVRCKFGSIERYQTDPALEGWGDKMLNIEDKKTEIAKFLAEWSAQDLIYNPEELDEDWEE